MQYTPHYNLNLPEGSDIVNPLIQDNPNYTAIDTALYNNKLRVVGTATHVKTGTNHAITLGDSDINQFKFVATGDYASGDTFTVDGVTVTARLSNGASIPTGAFKINSTVLCILDGTVLNLINVDGIEAAADISYNNTTSGLSASTVQDAIDEIDSSVDDISMAVSSNYHAQTTTTSPVTLTFDALVVADMNYSAQNWSYCELNVNGHTVFAVSAGGTTADYHHMWFPIRARKGDTITPVTTNGGIITLMINPIY